MKQLLLLIVALLGLVTLGRGPCQAQVEFHPRLTATEEYNDNIFLESLRENADFITIIAPGLAAKWTSTPLHLDFDYGFEFRKYQDNPEQDETSPKDTQRGLTTAEIFPGRTFSIGLLQEFSRVALDQRRPVLEENVIVNKSNLSHTQVRPQLRLNLTPAFEADLHYQFESLIYQSLRGDDSRSHLGFIELKKTFSRRLHWLLGYDNEFRRNKWTPDYNRQSVWTGFSAEVTRNLKVDARGGNAWLDFTSLTDRHTFVGNLSADYRLSAARSFGLSYVEDLPVAADDGLYKRKMLRAVLDLHDPAGERAKATPRWSVALSPYVSKNDFYAVIREDRLAGSSLNVRFPLARAVSCLLSGDYEYLRLLPAVERVRRYTLGGGLEYTPRNFQVWLHYLFTESNSTIERNDYRNNIVFLSLGLHF